MANHFPASQLRPHHSRVCWPIQGHVHQQIKTIEEALDLNFLFPAREPPEAYVYDEFGNVRRAKGAGTLGYKR